MNFLDNVIKYNIIGCLVIEVLASVFFVKWVIIFKDNGIGIFVEF